MPDHLDDRETRAPAVREADLFARLPALLARFKTTPGGMQQLAGIDPAGVTSRAALARLPVLTKPALMGLQKDNPPFADMSPEPLSAFGRLFTSPGPIFEPEGREADPWRAARGLYAAGVRRGQVVLNTFSYHLTPGGFILDSGARALGCPVIPAGPGNTEQQFQVIAAYRPSVYCGTPDFLKILLDAGAAAKQDLSCLKRAVVSGAAFPPSLQAEVKSRGIDAYQLYATADIGLVAYETAARSGMVVNEDIILEIVRPGTGDPLPDGEIGEVVVTSLDPNRPVVRLALGDLSAVVAGASACGRSNTRIKGWLGRADQTAKVKGMFVTPGQVAEIAKRHPQLGRVRLVVGREGEQDVMTLRAETAAGDPGLAAAVAETVQAVTKLKGAVQLLPPGSLPADGKVIADMRPVG